MPRTIGCLEGERRRFIDTPARSDAKRVDRIEAAPCAEASPADNTSPANKTWQIDTANRSPATPGLPIGLEAALSGQHAAAVGELAVEAAEQRDIAGDRELRSEARAASAAARGPSTVNAEPGSAMNAALILRDGSNSCTHDTRA